MHSIAVLAHAAVLARLLTAQRCSAQATVPRSAPPATVLQRCSATAPPPIAVQCSVLQCSALLSSNKLRILLHLAPHHSAVKLLSSVTATAMLKRCDDDDGED